MPNTEPAIDNAAVGARGAGPRAAARCATWRWRGPSPSAVRASGWRPWPRWPPSACASSPTTAPACRTTGSCAGPSSTRGGLGVTLAQHCEDSALAGGGHMHEGEWSSRLGIPGQPAEAEELMVMRDIALARLTGARVHFQHLSTAGSVAMVRAARCGPARSAPRPPRTTSRSPTSAAPSYDPVFKVNPPLRTDADVAAVKAGLADGALDAIATDHAPHAPHLKERPFDQAPPGHARPGDGARPAPSPSWTCRSRRCWRCCRGSRPSSPASTTATAARSRPAGRPTSA